MHRFYAQSVEENRLVIADDEAAHMKNTLRMRAGDEFIGFDGTGADYYCRISQIEKTVQADILRIEKNPTEPKTNVTLYQAYPKFCKMEEIVQKAVELGANRIVPFISSRCVKKPDNCVRLSRVALAAVKQCGRSIIPAIDEILSYKFALKEMKNHQKLIVCWERERSTSLMCALGKDLSDIAVVIGPEGGFEQSEITDMQESGGVTVTLGRRILRTQTASAAALSIIMHCMELN